MINFSFECLLEHWAYIALVIREEVVETKQLKNCMWSPLGDDVYHRKKEMENEGGLDYSCLSKKSGAFECCFRHYFKKEKKREISSMNFS